MQNPTPTPRLLDLGPDQANFVRSAARDWQAMSKNREWNSWMKIAAALEIGSRAMMRKVNKNESRGRPCNEAFSEWCKNAGFRNPEIEPSTRSHLLYLAQPQNREICDKLRAAMTPGDRLRIAHPDTMYKRVRKYFRDLDKENKPKKETRKDDRDAIIEELEAKLENSSGPQWFGRLSLSAKAKLIATQVERADIPGLFGQDEKLLADHEQFEGDER